MRHWRVHDGWVWAITFAPDGSSLLTATAEDAVDCWDTDGSHLRRLGNLGPFPGAAFSPDGGSLFLAFSDRLRVADPATGRPRREVAMPGLSGPVFLWFDADTGTVFAAERQRCWRVRPDDPLPARWDMDYCYADAWCHAGGQAECACWRPHGGEVTLRRAHDGGVLAEVRARPAGRGVTGSALSAGGRYLAIGHNAGLVALWDRDAGRTVATSAGHASGSVLGLAFHPTGGLLATAGHDGTVRLWGVPTGHQAACFDCGLGAMNRVAFAPDGLTLAATSQSGILALLDVDL
jgi:WD40 repeat protein